MESKYVFESTKKMNNEYVEECIKKLEINVSYWLDKFEIIIKEVVINGEYSYIKWDQQGQLHRKMGKNKWKQLSDSATHFVRDHLYLTK